MGGPAGRVRAAGRLRRLGPSAAAQRSAATGRPSRAGPAGRPPCSAGRWTWPGRRSRCRWARPPGATSRSSARGPAAGGLLATAARSTAAHHAPGTARFLVAALAMRVPGAGRRADRRAGRPASGSTRVDLPTLLAALADDLPTYLVVFGLDAAAAPQELPPDRLRALLRDGPPAGRHLLGWWRAVPPFAAVVRAGGRGRQAGRRGRAGRAGRAARPGLRPAGAVAAPPGPGGALGRPGRAGHGPGAVRRRRTGVTGPRGRSRAARRDVAGAGESDGIPGGDPDRPSARREPRGPAGHRQGRAQLDAQGPGRR